MEYRINHHCKACGLCDKVSQGTISFGAINHIEFREACFEAERLAKLAGDDVRRVEQAYDEVRRMLTQVVHRGPSEAQVRRIASECFVQAMEIIE